MRSSRAAMIGFLLVACSSSSLSLAQAPKTLAATMNVSVFPSNGQDASQQSKDESECYTWAVTNSGADPFELQKQAQAAQQQTQQQVQQANAATQGAGARGAVGGAAAGALIGGIADEDKSEAAAAGAALGAVAARRGAKRAGQQAAASAQQSGAATQQATAAQITNFKNAFSVCLESKKYMVKF